MSNHADPVSVHLADELSISLREGREVESAMCNLYAGLEAPTRQMLDDPEGVASLSEKDRMSYLLGFLAKANHLMYLQRDLGEILDRVSFLIRDIKKHDEEEGADNE